MAETLAEIRTLVRDLASKQSTTEITNATLTAYINNWYQNKLPSEISLNLDATWRLQTLPDTANYSVSATYQSLSGYVSIDDETLEFYDDPQQLAENYPDNWILEQEIETGDASTTDFSGTLEASENILPESMSLGDDVETFTDDGAGTLTGSAGGSGTIDYDIYAWTLSFAAAPADAVAISAHYATYTAAQPEAVLFFNDELSFRPVPDVVYEVRIKYEKRPAALSADSSEPTKKYWGDLIAYGAAIDILERNNDRAAANELASEYKRILDVCLGFSYKTMRTQTVIPQW